MEFTMSKPEKQHFQRGHPEADHMLRAFARYTRISIPSGPDDEEVSTDGSHQFLQADRTVVGVPTPLDFED